MRVTPAGRPRQHPQPRRSGINVLVPTLLPPESTALRRAAAAYIARIKGESRLCNRASLRWHSALTSWSHVPFAVV